LIFIDFQEQRAWKQTADTPPFSDIPSGLSFDFSYDEGAEGLVYRCLTLKEKSGGILRCGLQAS
jgi:hypothetical protein